jgi:hypothetical protein
MPNMSKRFQSRSNGRKYCMDVVGDHKHDGAPIIVFPCHGGPNQRFRYLPKTKQIKTLSSRKCVDIQNGKLLQNKCNTRKKSQKWVYKRGHWKSLKNRKCIDVEYGNYKRGALITYPCHSGPNQRFV